MRYRRVRGDVILVYKVLRDGNQSIRDLFMINESRTRGHNFKLYIPLVKTAICKHFFSIGVINNWSSLPQEVVNAVSLDSFKSKLDTDWEDEYMYFNKKNYRINRKLYKQLVYSSLLILAVAALFPFSLSLSLSLSLYTISLTKDILQ